MTSFAAKAPKGDAKAELIEEVSELVSQITGVQLGARQASMVESRLSKRISDLNMRSEGEYLDYFRRNRDKEVNELVSLLTTHHTFFFREYAHFDYLEREFLPKLVASGGAGSGKVIRVWSAACSRGQEVYSLSMFLRDWIDRHAPGWNYEILGTDVDPRSVAYAENGVYPGREIQSVPLQFLEKNWAKGTGDIAHFVKAGKRIRSMCKFQPLNLKDFEPRTFGRKFDVIFCRNVFIYFSPEQIAAITRKLLDCLEDDGALFLGISETLSGLNLPVSTAGPSIFRKASFNSAVNSAGNSATSPAVGSSSKASVTAPSATAPVPSTRPALSVVSGAAKPAAASAPAAQSVRVLCVDDSTSILALLKKILAKDMGFEVVATAANGQEALEYLKKNTVDLMTLDIHMPVMGGLDLLKALQGKDHPPVVMISSVSREDSDLALKCLESGAVDYVEKPAMANLQERSDEIRMKLKFAARNAKSRKTTLTISRDIAHKPEPIRHTGEKIRVMIGGFPAIPHMVSTLKEFQGSQPPTVVLIEGTGDSSADAFCKMFEKAYGKKATLLAPGTFSQKLSDGAVYVADGRAFLGGVKAEAYKRGVSVLVYGPVSEKLESALKSWKPGQVLVEEGEGVERTATGTLTGRLAAIATDLTPATSFAYLSQQFLSGA